MITTALEREMYTEADAARLLQVSPSTLHYWLEGGQRRGRTYQPIIRPEPKGGHADVTWAEFVEANLLKGYRRDANVPMRELRTFIEKLRDSLGVPYPLAHQKPYVTSGRRLVMEAQRQADLAGDWWLVGEASGQLALLPAADAFYRQVVWDNDLAAGWRIAGADSPVLVDPDVRFGRPQVGGVSTEVIWEHNRAGESDEEIAEAFDLSTAQVWGALAYELDSRVKRAA
ncbi:DUF433 domain-containing protein [Blastococcus sp. TF02-09]|uniref:DUF433 domain-containing protein n=1 Tax=Blastococcus sp. TF02-09 TaxID=2250576 RepID=UPI001314D6B6|nr:DUF433 domain-containing protein [Blastococcus sp. TF02-9]